MSTENEQALALPEGIDGLIAPTASVDAFADLATATKYLPRLSLTAGTSDCVLEGLCPIGHWAMIKTKKEVVDLGTEIRGWICGLRLKAMHTKRDPIVAYFDPTKPDFLDIVERAKNEEDGALAGPEFLIYLPPPVDSFILYFMSSKTAKREAGQVRQLLGKPATFKITLLTNKTNKWHGPVITMCSIGLAQPPQEKFKKVLENFKNPPASEVESTTEDEKAATGRER